MIDNMNLLIEVIEKDVYSFKQCAEEYADNGRVLTAVTGYKMNDLQALEQNYGLETLVSVLNAYADYLDERANDDTRAEGTE